jgi:hypothetical protein
VTVLKQWDWAARSRQSTHPWDTWLDGQIRRLAPSDFGALGHVPKAFANAAKLAAKKRGLLVRVQKDGDAVVIQAFRADGEAPATPTTEPAPTARKGKGK